jgi:hypothetical protein
MYAENVCLSGQTGSGRRTVKMTRLTRTGHLDTTRLLHVRCQLIEIEIKIKPFRPPVLKDTERRYLSTP